ncbi:MAG: aldo/keto reductase, partial [Candidatus Atribacteria bacterium]|nr:aldo/keto reductase [Candidatus Atribacteria bacterium]
YNRYGQAFDRGETFAGVDYEKGLEAVKKLRNLIPEGFNMAQFALKWILMFPEVSVVIPGAKNQLQAENNTKASGFPPLDEFVMEEIRKIYETYIRQDVHHRW